MANEDWIDLGENDEACAACGGDGCAACGHRGLVSRCYACDAVAVGTRDRRPEGGSLETACARHAEAA